MRQRGHKPYTPSSTHAHTLTLTHTYTMHCFLSSPLLSLIPSPQLDDFSMKGFFINPTSGNRCSPTSHTLKKTHSHAQHTHRPPSMGHFDVSTYLQTKHKISSLCLLKCNKYKGTHNTPTHQYTQTYPHSQRPLISACK